MRGFLNLMFCAILSAAAWISDPWISSSWAADPYPSRPIRLIIPGPPAGITDLSARLVAEGLRAKLNQPIIADNKPGANGIVGLRELMKAEPDGYTLFVGNVGTFALNYAMDAKAPFDPMKDVVPIAGTSEYATTMVVNKSMPVDSVQEFIAYAKERPDKLSYASTGEGSLAYLSTQLLMKQTGIRMVHVPYRGGPLALNDLLGGQIQLIIEVSPVVQEQVKAGAIKGLAVSSPYRQSGLPDVPTFEQAGVPGVVVTGWLGIYGPQGLPDDIRHKLGAAIVDVVKQPDILAKFRAIGFEPTGQDVREFTAHHAAEIKRWLAFYTEVGLRK